VMSSAMGFSLKGNQLILYLYVQPRASKATWGNIYNDKIKLRITAAPIGGQANKQCIAYLAKSLKVPKSNICILQGETSRSKVVRINNIDLKSWEAVLQQIRNAQ